MEYNFISSDRVISDFLRTTKSDDIEVSDLYEWIAEAMGFLSVPGVLEQRLIFLEVKGFHSLLPQGFKNILQVAKDNNPEETLYNPKKEITTEDCIDCTPCTTVLTDCNGNPLCDVNEAFYRPKPCYNPFPITYNQWLNSVSYSHFNRFTPIRLSNHTLFKSSVCKELDWDSIYSSVQFEYSIVGREDSTRKIRFNFEEGVVALSYLGDANTGLEPLIPDDQRFITAIKYYLLWKHSEVMMMQGIQGAVSLNDRFMGLWLKYCKQAKNHAMMPNLASLDNIMQNTYKVLPSLRVFSDMFSSLSDLASTSYIVNENLI